MITTSIWIQNLYAPCNCACKYCLLYSCKKAEGVDYFRGKKFAERFIEWGNYNTCAVGLKLNEKQQTFLGNNELSLVQAYVSLLNDTYLFLPYDIYLDDIVIGFTMVFYKPANNELSKESCYGICRFMIAEEYQ